MTDRYARIREALAMGPTLGPWSVRYDYVVQAKSFDEGRLVPIAQPYGLRVDGSDLFANAALIAACDPNTIRELLAERDALIHDNAEYVRAANELAAENERLRKLCQDGYRRGYQAGSKGLREMYDAIQEVKRQDAWGNTRLTEALMAAEERAERAEAENKRLREELDQLRQDAARWMAQHQETGDAD